MKVAIFGGTGFVGGHLIKALKKQGHESVVLDIRRDAGWKTAIKEVDAVINLAGAPLIGKRWDVDYKALIHSSRVEGTRKIVDAMAAAREDGKGPGILINASAVGYYGASLEESFDENSAAGADFLAFVCREWEAEALRAQREFGIRTVIGRFGVILGSDDGALQKMLPPFKAFIGSPLGTGKQPFPWVHIDDVVGIVIHALEKDTVKGPLNVVGPELVNNKEFSKALAKSLNRPMLPIPVPGIALHIMLGEAANMLIEGQRVEPKETLASGYEFKFPKLEPALKDLV